MSTPFAFGNSVTIGISQFLQAGQSAEGPLLQSRDQIVVQISVIAKADQGWVAAPTESQNERAEATQDSQLLQAGQSVEGSRRDRRNQIVGQSSNTRGRAQSQQDSRTCTTINERVISPKATER